MTFCLAIWIIFAVGLGTLYAFSQKEKGNRDYKMSGIGIVVLVMGSFCAGIFHEKEKKIWHRNDVVQVDQTNRKD